jgi:hypothetical protein
MKKQDLREYSENELSLQVFNDEYLYKQRRNLNNLKNSLDEFFLYTDEQFKILKQDILDDLNEE